MSDPAWIHSASADTLRLRSPRHSNEARKGVTPQFMEQELRIRSLLERRGVSGYQEAKCVDS